MLRLLHARALELHNGGLTGTLAECVRYRGWSRWPRWSAGQQPQRNLGSCVRCCRHPSLGWTRAWRYAGSARMVSWAGLLASGRSGSNSDHWRGSRRKRNPTLVARFLTSRDLNWPSRQDDAIIIIIHFQPEKRTKLALSVCISVSCRYVTQAALWGFWSRDSVVLPAVVL